MTPSIESFRASERYFLEAAESYRDAGQPGIALQCIKLAAGIRAKALAAMDAELMPLYAESAR